MLYLQFIKNNQQMENRLLTPQFFAYEFGDLLGLHQLQR